MYDYDFFELKPDIYHIVYSSLGLPICLYNEEEANEIWENIKVPKINKLNIDKVIRLVISKFIEKKVKENA